MKYLLEHHRVLEATKRTEAQVMALGKNFVLGDTGFDP